MSEARFDVGMFLEQCQAQVSQRAVAKIMSVTSIDATRAVFSIRSKPISRRQLGRRFRFATWAPEALNIDAVWEPSERILVLRSVLTFPRIPTTAREKAALKIQLENFNAQTLAVKFVMLANYIGIDCSMPFFGARGAVNFSTSQAFMDALDVFCREYDFCSVVVQSDHRPPGHA
ncbi:MAG TPA: hypothetical protein VN495_00170 [Candidatus Paceibacterota bacterium]|nr:hypothetical protein [Candidatus Paceibacterota bacterium]